MSVINTFFLNIKANEWIQLNDDSYYINKTVDIFDTNIAIHCYDELGNNINVGTKIEQGKGQITFYYDKAENIKVIFLKSNTIEEIPTSISHSKYPTSTYLNEDKGWLEQAHITEDGTPVSEDRVEIHTVSPINSAVQLTEIIDEYYGVEFKLKENNTNLTRVYNLDDLIITTNSYYIGKNNMIYCSSNLIGKLVEVYYKGKGRTIINCNMIYYRDAINGIPRILEDLIDAGYEAIDTLATMGDVSLIIKELKDSITIGNQLHTTLASDFTIGNNIHNTLTNDINNGNTLHNTLTNDINNGNNSHNILSLDNSEANRIQPILHTDVTEAKELTLGGIKSKFNSIDTQISNINVTMNGIDNKTTLLESNKQDKIITSTSQPSGHVNGRIWIQLI